jgi:hypothetical protein
VLLLNQERTEVTNGLEVVLLLLKKQIQLTPLVYQRLLYLPQIYMKQPKMVGVYLVYKKVILLT